VDAKSHLLPHSAKDLHHVPDVMLGLCDSHSIPWHNHYRLRREKLLAERVNIRCDLLSLPDDWYGFSNALSKPAHDHTEE
jgi:hypothetical protein